jgi:hypothetical protein
MLTTALQVGGRRLLVPPPPSAASGQHKGSATSSNSSAASGSARETGTRQHAAAAMPPQRQAWGGNSAAALAGQQGPRQPPKQTLAYDAADFVPGPSGGKADGAQWQGAAYAEEYQEDLPQYGSYADEQGHSNQSEQEWYQPEDGGQYGQGGEWVPQAEPVQWQGEGSPGTDEEEALQQQLSGLHVDEPPSGDEGSEWLLMCEVRIFAVPGLGHQQACHARGSTHALAAVIVLHSLYKNGVCLHVSLCS